MDVAQSGRATRLRSRDEIDGLGAILMGGEFRARISCLLAGTLVEGGGTVLSKGHSDQSAVLDGSRVLWLVPGNRWTRGGCNYSNESRLSARHPFAGSPRAWLSGVLHTESLRRSEANGGACAGVAAWVPARSVGTGHGPMWARAE